MLISTPLLSAALAAALAAPQQAPPSTPPPESERPLTRIVQNLGRDLRDLPGLDTLVIVGAGGAAALVAHRSDARVDRWTLEHPAPGFADIGRVTGDGFVQGGLAIGTFAIGSLSGHRLTTHIGSDLIRAQMVNMVTTWTLKLAVNRTRPSGGSHAFPSGHSSASFTTAGVLWRHFGWKGGVPTVAGASFIAWSRVRQRNHWVSDTVFGAALGTAAAWAVTRGHGDRTWTVTPVVSPAGAGLLVRW